MIDVRPGKTGLRAIAPPATSDLGVRAGYGPYCVMTGQTHQTTFAQAGVLTRNLSGQTEIGGSQSENLTLHAPSTLRCVRTVRRATNLRQTCDTTCDNPCDTTCDKEA